MKLCFKNRAAFLKPAILKAVKAVKAVKVVFGVQISLSPLFPF
jgi:hypothetical protein